MELMTAEEASKLSIFNGTKIRSEGEDIIEEIYSSKIKEISKVLSRMTEEGSFKFLIILMAIDKGVSSIVRVGIFERIVNKLVSKGYQVILIGPGGGNKKSNVTRASLEQAHKDDYIQVSW